VVSGHQFKKFMSPFRETTVTFSSRFFVHNCRIAIRTLVGDLELALDFTEDWEAFFFGLMVT
jgi:hypothetical protein